MRLFILLYVFFLPACTFKFSVVIAVEDLQVFKYFW